MKNAKHQPRWVWKRLKALSNTSYLQESERKRFICSFSSLSHTANYSTKDPKTISRIHAQISQFTFFQSRGWKEDFHPFPGTQTPGLSSLTHKKSNDKKPFEVPQNLSAARSQKVKELSNALMYFSFLHSLKAIFSNLAAFYFWSINSSAGV